MGLWVSEIPQETYIELRLQSSDVTPGSHSPRQEAQQNNDQRFRVPLRGLGLWVLGIGLARFRVMGSEFGGSGVHKKQLAEGYQGGLRLMMEARLEGSRGWGAVGTFHAQK